MASQRIVISEPGARDGGAGLLAACDLFEAADRFVMRMDIPGLETQHVIIEVENETRLRISGRRPAEPTLGEELFTERKTSYFSRVIEMNPLADLPRTSASAHRGVLTVVIPKRKGASVHRVPVTSEDLDQADTLNAVFSMIPVSSFPTPAIGKLIVIDSSTSILETFGILRTYTILSAPVRDVSQPDSAPWDVKYLGFVDAIGMILFFLHEMHGAERFSSVLERQDALAKTTVAMAMSLPRSQRFVALDLNTATLLDCMILCGSHGFRRLPIFDGDTLVNIVTQSALVQTICANMDRLSSVADQSLYELGLGANTKTATVTMADTLRRAMELIREYDVNGLPIVDDSGHVLSCVSSTDIRHVVVAADSMCSQLDTPLSQLPICDRNVITCLATDKLRDVISWLVESRIHRIFVTDAQFKLLRVVSLRDILVRFVKEPVGFFESLLRTETVLSRDQPRLAEAV